MEKLITPEEFQELTGIKMNTQARWRWAGKLSFVKIGGAVRYERDVVEKLIEQGRRNYPVDPKESADA